VEGGTAAGTAVGSLPTYARTPPSTSRWARQAGGYSTGVEVVPLEAHLSITSDKPKSGGSSTGSTVDLSPTLPFFEQG